MYVYTIIGLLKGLSSEIYVAESCVSQQATLKGRGAEVFSWFFFEAPLSVSTITYKIWGVIN